MPLYDGRACPDCGAVVCGREDRRLHREWHMQERAWQEWVTDTLMRAAKAAGLPVIDVQPGELEHQADKYARVDLTKPDDDEEDWEDE